MNILMINGSPRKGGTIDTMLKTAENYAAGKDSIDTFDLYMADIKPCRACMSCRSTGTCSLPEDDGHLLAEKFRAADMVIVGTPTYWSNMSGVLKNMFDRLVYVLVKDADRGLKPRMEGRKAVIVAACSAPAVYNTFVSKESRAAVQSIERILKPAGYNITSIEVTGTKNMKTLPKKYKLKMEDAMQIK